MSLGNCDCCDRKNVPVQHHATDYERGHVGDVTQCFVCAGDIPDPYCELEVVCELCGGDGCLSCKGLGTYTPQSEPVTMEDLEEV